VSDRYLEIAREIGVSIAEAAVWSDGRCSWVGGMPDEGPFGLRMTYSSFGADLYGGTAGVGLALAELQSATESPELRRTAIGALEHALRRADEIDGRVRLGLYVGALGVAFAAARAGTLLEDDRLVARGLELAESVDLPAEPVENDLLAGRAGGIVALLVLRKLGAGDWALERAAALGDALVAAAVGGAWPSPSFPDQPSLTGLSHGAAGIAVALCELYRATGSAEYRAAAEAGFAYERGLFDPVSRNWPDLREIALRGRPPDARPPSATFWCHGAPGIAVSRLRAAELDPQQALLEEARIAVETTAAAVRAELQAGNYSLCHGLAGNAEVVAEGRHLLREDAESLVCEVADAGIELYGHDPSSWPGGVFDGRTDSLFLGRAGTARFYLRLHDPSMPSLLLMKPEAFGSGADAGGSMLR
jgi:lantibiotic biosynthesis protein